MRHLGISICRALTKFPRFRGSVKRPVYLISGNKPLGFEPSLPQTRKLFSSRLSSTLIHSILVRFVLYQTASLKVRFDYAIHQYTLIMSFCPLWESHQRPRNTLSRYLDDCCLLCRRRSYATLQIRFIKHPRPS